MSRVKRKAEDSTALERQINEEADFQLKRRFGDEDDISQSSGQRRKTVFLNSIVCDFSTINEFGQSWDFSDVHMRNRAYRRVMKDKLMFIIASFCENHNEDRSRKHFDMCMFMYKLQMDAGRHFIHKIQHGTDLTQEKVITDVLGRTTVALTKSHSCAYDTRIQQYIGFLGFITNSPFVARAINKTSVSGYRRGDRIRQNDFQTISARYPQKLCSMIVDGMLEQEKANTQQVFVLQNISFSIQGGCRSRVVFCWPSS